MVNNNKTTTIQEQSEDDGEPYLHKTKMTFKRKQLVTNYRKKLVAQMTKQKRPDSINRKVASLKDLE